MAVTIDAPQSRVWPWLVQDGVQSPRRVHWDPLANGSVSSAEWIHPEWQDLAVGDRLASTPSGSARIARGAYAARGQRLRLCSAVRLLKVIADLLFWEPTIGSCRRGSSKTDRWAAFDSLIRITVCPCRPPRSPEHYLGISGTAFSAALTRGLRRVGAPRAASGSLDRSPR
jgi:hypothetical protein